MPWPHLRLLIARWLLVGFLRIDGVMINLSVQNTLPTNDDGHSTGQSIDDFPFFGVQQSKLYVNTNGIISFGQGVRNFTPVPFPIVSIPVVAPFWSDVDTNRGGSIHYGPMSVRDRNRVAAQVHSSFNPSWGYYVKWNAVGGYGGNRCCNTFEALLLTDRTSSFVMFNFQTIQWTRTTSARSVPAQMGFADGRTHYWSHPYSRTTTISSLPTHSNCGVRGRFIWSVGAAVIVPIEEVLWQARIGTARSSPDTVCQTNPCQNGGSCRPSGETATCYCTPSWAGARCEQEITCGPLSIENGYTTSPDSYYDATVIYDCDAGYTLTDGSQKRTCELDVDSGTGLWSGTAPRCA